jgi:hypothetical protein
MLDEFDLPLGDRGRIVRTDVKVLAKRNIELDPA